VVKAK